MMSTVHLVGNEAELFLKGAPEEVLKICSKKMVEGKETFFTVAEKNAVLSKVNEWGNSTLRVLALAYRKAGKMQEVEDRDKEKGEDYFARKYAEEELVFVGLAGMLDPPRPEVREALKVARLAGIKVKIITGDNVLTTRAIAKKIGLDVTHAFNGTEIDAMDDNELKEAVEKANIFARASPKHKYRIVSMLEEMGEVVAVTGDGVNDAPALKKADIGISMGVKGTQVSKEASDIVLQDDNFATIISIIKEGRRVYANILSFVKLMLSTNFVLLGIVGLGTLLNLPLPLLPLQILWINIVTDSLPALALGAEKAEKGIMEKAPHKKGESILKKFMLFMAIVTVIQTIGYIAFFWYGLSTDRLLGIDTFNLAVPSQARTIIFTGIVLFELVVVFNCRGLKKSLLNGGFFENKKLIAAVGISVILQLIIVYHPLMQAIFKTTPLGPMEWGIIILISSPVLFVPEITEFVKRAFHIRSSE
jgi:Ca2+-transporting ATPase